MNEKKNKTNWQQVLSGIVALGFLAWMFGGGLDWQADHDLAKIKNDVAADSVRQYEMAARNGTKIDKCVHAGMVSAAYLQANDEPKYKLWKATENRDCADAGVPR